MTTSAQIIEQAGKNGPRYFRFQGEHFAGEVAASRVKHLPGGGLVELEGASIQIARARPESVILEKVAGNVFLQNGPHGVRYFETANSPHGGGFSRVDARNVIRTGEHSYAKVNCLSAKDVCIRLLRANGSEAAPQLVDDNLIVRGTYAGVQQKGLDRAIAILSKDPAERYVYAAFDVQPDGKGTSHRVSVLLPQSTYAPGFERGTLTSKGSFIRALVGEAYGIDHKEIGKQVKVVGSYREIAQTAIQRGASFDGEAAGFSESVASAVRATSGR